jgi:hypothetical protein
MCQEPVVPDTYTEASGDPPQNDGLSERFVVREDPQHLHILPLN